MTSPEDGDSVTQPPAFSTVPTLHLPNTRSPAREEKSPGSSSTSLPLRSSSPLPAAKRTGALYNTLSRSASPNGRLSLSLSRFGKSGVASPLANLSEDHDETRSLIVRAFSPPVAVFASLDTDDIAKRKGFNHGFYELLRPFGEKVMGKMVVRDSMGASRAWDDFAVQFVDLERLAKAQLEKQDEPQSNILEPLEELMEKYVEQGYGDAEASSTGSIAEMSPYYRLFINRLLSPKRLVSHETFVHPVACVISISSNTANPIETLRQLYAQTAQGNRTLPAYVNPDYLRYYVLVHDEDRDDFAKSSALFDQMKRHFGLHCHLLRLRSDHCAPSDDDAVEVPLREWLTPSEDLTVLNDAENLVDLDTPNPCIFETDTTAIRSFIRELVAQSIIPHMENRIALWNEQVASRRRGISGRFMSMSKRWAGLGSGFGTSSRNTSVPAGTGAAGGVSGNYDSLQGIYHHSTPEATLRKMADFAMMLRDFKLAASTYELIRTDFADDKAWKYLAGANEMCAVASLLNPLATAAKFRVENLDQMIETASYSYLTRCGDPQYALRTIVVGVELLKVRGQAAAECAGKWALRALEMGLVAQGSVGRVLVSERIASCLSARRGRKRKGGLWCVVTADEWMKLGRADLAEARLRDAEEIYAGTGSVEGLQAYSEMTTFMEQLQLAVRIRLSQARKRAASEVLGGLGDADEQEEQDREQQLDQTVEYLEQLGSRNKRRSLMGAANPVDTTLSLGMPPLSPVRTRADSLSQSRDDDDFE